LAVAAALVGKKSTFVRTPKFNIAGTVKEKVHNKEQVKDPLFFFELLLTIYFIAGVLLAFYYHDYSMLPYHIMLAFGFGMICFFTLQERLSLAI